MFLLPLNKATKRQYGKALRWSLIKDSLSRDNEIFLILDRDTKRVRPEWDSKGEKEVDQSCR